MSASKFYLNHVDHQELMRVLLSLMRSAEGIGMNMQRYKSPDSVEYLDVHFTNKGQITKIVKSPNFPQTKIDFLSSEIKRILLHPVEFSIGQCVGFCNDKVDGYFTYKDLFQIVPVPTGAPQCQYAAGENPFLLQFRYRACPDVMVDNYRKMSEAMKYARLLNLFSNRRISLGTRFTHFDWVLKTDDPANWFSEWKQLGYMYSGHSGKIESYTDTHSIPSVGRVPFRDYYAGHRVSTTESLNLPDNLEESLDLAFALDTTEWQKFYMACSWLYSTNFTWKDSSSSAFIALVTAIECLIDKSSVKCDCCNQPKSAISRKFRDFLTRYFPSIGEFPTEKKLLYAIRSQLAHGMTMLEQDLEPVWSIGFRQYQENALQRNARLIVNVAIYNWLQDRN